MRPINALWPLLLAGCSGSEQATDRQAPVETGAPVGSATPAQEPTGGAARNETGLEQAPAPLPSPTALPGSEQDAAGIVRRYFGLLAERNYVEAHKLWTVGVGDLADETFADQFSRYREYRGVVGPPGRMEGAAGSLYVTVPVQVSGVTTAGERFEEPQVVTLRRVNNVPGATAEQLEWRITKVDKPPH